LEVIYYTLVAAGLYFISDWILDRIEVSRGKRFDRGVRSLVFFIIILALASITFGFINVLVPPSE
jgi:MFS family permease